MHIVGVICARGGSKRIPFKNLKGLNGEPLVRYAIKAALKATMIDRLIVSTDNPEITRVARKSWGEKRLFSDSHYPWLNLNTGLNH